MYYLAHVTEKGRNMQIPIYEQAINNDVYSVTSASLTLSKSGISTALKNTRLVFTSKQYGLKTVPCNYKKLSVKQQKNIALKKVLYNGRQVPAYTLNSKLYQLVKQGGLL